jgi:fatty-acyl-CoA synthase
MHYRLRLECFYYPFIAQRAHIGMVENLMPNEFYIFEENKTTLFMALPTMLTMMQKTAIFQN